MRKNLLLATVTALLLGTLSGTSWATDQRWGVSYSVGVPVGETRDWVGKTSWRGVTVEGRNEVKPNVAVGVSLGWNVFNEKTARLTSFPEENLDVSGTQFRYTNAFPLYLNVTQYFSRRNSAYRPYVTGHAGTMIVERRLELGVNAVQETKWRFALAAEAGVAIPMDYNVDMLVLARYNHGFPSGDEPAQQYVTFQIGVVSF